MYRTKNILVTIVLNIFLMLMASVVLEYNNLAERFSLLENNVNVALDMSVDASTASEELFSADYQEYMTSMGLGYNDSYSVGAITTLYRRGQWFQANSYVLAGFYEAYNRLPDSATEYENYASRFRGNTTLKIFEWLYGSAGEEYSAIPWANKSITTSRSLGETGISSSSRRPTSKFQEFYTEIGKKLKMRGVVKQKDGESFTIRQDLEFPILDNMGLTFSDSQYTRIDSDYMTDNFCMSFHAGKIRNGRASVYFLTPNSLGVTYVPIEVLKPTFIANLDTLARLQKVTNNTQTSDTSAITASLNSADGCLPVNVYTGTNLSQETHVVGANRHIINDGSVEYDMDSVQVKVDYFLADFYSPQYKNIAAKIEGSLTGERFGSQAGALNALGGALQNSDTYQHYKSGERIVAKVTVKLKVYIAYESSILQWLSHKDFVRSGSTGENHYSVKTVDVTTGNIMRRTTPDGLSGRNHGGIWQVNGDGVWYQYSTYIANTR